MEAFIEKYSATNKLIEYVKTFSISTPHSQRFTEEVEKLFKVKFNKNIISKDIDAIFNQNQKIKVEKPPLGLMPRYLYNEQRFQEIYSAISRYYQAGKAIPIEWIEEYNDISKTLKNEKA